MNVADHAHCEICQKTIQPGETLCNSKDCFEKKEEAQAMKKRTIYMFIALIVAAVLLSKFVTI